jgi:hypothetical protein
LFACYLSKSLLDDENVFLRSASAGREDFLPGSG